MLLLACAGNVVSLEQLRLATAHRRCATAHKHHDVLTDHFSSARVELLGKLQSHLHILQELLIHGAILCHLLHDGVLAVKVHDLKAHQRLVCHLGVKETHIEELHSQFIL